MSTDRISEYLAQFSQARTQMIEQLRRAIVGQADVIEQILAAIFTRGHCLLVGVPGLAKTLMVSSISQILDVAFKRIQFTPDLMPSDITGTSDPRRGRAGQARVPLRPAGRSSPTSCWPTRSIARRPRRRPPCSRPCRNGRSRPGQETYNLPEPFFVIATQNPIEQEGTYPLPEAQLDRFMFNIKVDYPSFDEEKRILDMATKDEVAEIDQGAQRQGDRQHAEAGPQRAGRRLRRATTSLRLVRATRPRDADGAGVREARWSTGAPGRGRASS